MLRRDYYISLFWITLSRDGLIKPDLLNFATPAHKLLLEDLVFWGKAWTNRLTVRLKKLRRNEKNESRWVMLQILT